jgi:trimethylamine--corrinoid protein Co-methyltransferase
MTTMILQSNYTEFNTPQFRKLSPDQLERLHHASLEILDRTGVRLYDQGALDLLERAGVAIEEGNRVRIPPAMVEWALSVAPRRVVLCDRHGRRVMPLERRNVFFGPGSDCPNVLDHRTGERRRGTLQDVVEGVRVCDALPNIDFLMSICIASDVDQEIADRYQMRAMLMNSTKPILFVTTEFEGCVDAVEMAQIVAGGEESLRRNPICACYINVTSPLRHNAEALRKLLFLAQRGLPTTYTPVVLRGISGPVTVAGALALANAGELVGLVLAQLTREGTPVILTGGVNDMLDMRTLGDIYAAPENRVMCVELAHYYGLPIFGLAGASDAKLPDQQAAAEAAFSLLLEAMSGAQMVHDVGYLESGMCNSLEQIVICDELINYVKRFMEGLTVDEETLALDVIDEVGPDGDFLGTRHTSRHFREDWYPELFDRRNYDGWASAGAKALRDRARERVEQILSDHQAEPLASEVQDRVDAVVERAAGGQ